MIFISKVVRFIPTLLTLANLISGFTSILYTIKGDYVVASLFILLAMLFDGLDGRVARSLNNATSFGVELDSLSDAVSFGIAPALLIYFSYLQSVGILAYICSVVYISCGISRLARFNTTKGIDYFEGLPIPVAGAFFATMVLSNISINLYQFIIWSFILSYLMISRIRYPTFKNFNKVIRSKNTVFFILLFAFVITISWIINSNQVLIIPFFYYIMAGPVLELKKTRSRNG